MSGINTSGANPPGDSLDGAKLTIVWLERDDLLASSTPPSFPLLDKDLTTDVLVVGGGIAGLHIAYEILQSGLKKVVLIDDGSE